MFSFPCRMLNEKVQIVSGRKPSPMIWEKIKQSEQELMEERAIVRHLLG